MAETKYETTGVVHELIDALKELDARFFEGPNALGDDQQVLEGYKWIFSILQVALDTQVWGDPANPRFVDIVGPYKKWGGDNADAFYEFAPMDPNVTYRVTGTKGDAVYLSLTVYGGPRDGHYSERIVGTVNNRDHLNIGADGTFELMMGKEKPKGWDGPFLQLEDDAVAAITRDYLEDPVRGQRCQWHIEALDPPTTYREHDADLARRFRAALTWVRDQAQLVPLGFGEPNQIDEPYPVQKVTFGWAAGDAAYAMGSFDLAEDEALVITGRSPECAFWNCCLWNQFMHTYNSDYERVTINGAQTHYEDDGSWTLVVAHEDPGHPNWLSTAGHPRGRIWFRWFYPSDTPARPETKVVKLDEIPAIRGF
ncbi:MAG: DUF1214 domain-containing protein [Actinobacteria bacterium]|nr:DUF1214 domain-containing protein [Actinomycetota bacterium]